MGSLTARNLGTVRRDGLGVPFSRRPNPLTLTQFMADHRPDYRRADDCGRMPVTHLVSDYSTNDAPGNQGQRTVSMAARRAVIPPPTVNRRWAVQNRRRDVDRVHRNPMPGSLVTMIMTVMMTMPTGVTVRMVRQSRRAGDDTCAEKDDKAAFHGPCSVTNLKFRPQLDRRKDDNGNSLNRS